MTALNTLPRTAASAAVVTEFFDRYRAHDVEGMTDLCAINADFSYVPVEVWGKQRVLRGDGTVGTVGKPLWTGLIASFPNLSNTVHSIASNEDGDVVAEVDIEGVRHQDALRRRRPGRVRRGAGRAQDGAVRAERIVAEHGYLRPARRA